VQFGTWIGNLYCASTPEKVSNLPSLTAAVSNTRYQASLLVVASNGELWAWDNGRTPDPGGTSPTTTTARRLNFGNVRAIAAGQDHELILRTDGTVWGRGDNTYGQIGR
jgi:alpha-tubulin suppressor-like RCC1 family protein